MKFIAETYRHDGVAATEVIEAQDAAEAADILRRRGLLVSEVRAADDDARVSSQHDRPAGKRQRIGANRRLKLLTGFLRQLSVLVSTGTPLVEAITSLERQSEDPYWSRVLADVRENMEEGRQLSEAMASHPECFDLVCRNLIAAGETGGILEEVLTRLASLVRKQHKIRSEVVGAMAYPCALILISIGVLTAMIGFVLPRFGGLFKSLDRPVPASTQVLLDLSMWLKGNWWMIAIALPVLIFAGVLASKMPGAKPWWDRFMLRAPILGDLVRNLAAARVARVMGILIDGKVALLDCLRLVQGTLGNTLYVQCLRRAENAVTRGEGASGALAAEIEGVRLFPPSLIEAMRSGERTGKIGAVLLSVADALDEDNDVLLRATTRLMEPLILSVLGIIVGLVTMSMFLPLFDLAAAGPAGAPAQ